MILRASLLAILLVCAAFGQKEWDEPFPPHRIADNLYYVGSKGLASYLITTSEGDILINSSFERTVPIIRKSVEQLGYKFTDIKIVLTSHAHADHVAGNALVKEYTAAKIYVMGADAAVAENGGKGQYLYKELWKPCKVDRVLKDGDVVTLGKAKLTGHLTPGHTRGCTTWTMDATDKGKTYHVVIAGSPYANSGYQLVNNKDYPEIATDFARTFQVMKSLPCDIFLGAHGSYYGMEAKYAALKKNPDSNPFVDPAGYQAFVAEREKAVQTTLAQQKKP